jgi:hypothetical protein
MKIFPLLIRVHTKVQVVEVRQILRKRRRYVRNFWRRLASLGTGPLVAVSRASLAHVEQTCAKEYGENKSRNMSLSDHDEFLFSGNTAHPMAVVPL